MTQNDKYLKEGDVIEIKKGVSVYADIPEHFVYANKIGSWIITHARITVEDVFEYLAGKYIVTKTTFDGGGHGHGSGDTYPDGYHVFCVKVDNERIKIDFYQSGSFTAMIENITPVGKAKIKWEFN